MGAQAIDTTARDFVVRDRHESQAPTAGPNSFDLDQKKTFGQRGDCSLGPLHERDAASRRHEVIETDRSEVILTPETVEIEVIKARHCGREPGVVLIDKRKRRTRYDVLDSKSGGNPLGQRRLARAKIAVEEDDVTISEATGQGFTDCRGLGWTMANDLQRRFCQGEVGMLPPDSTGEAYGRHVTKAAVRRSAARVTDSARVAERPRAPIAEGR